VTTTRTTPVPVACDLFTSAVRPDGVPKVKGQFAYSSDLWGENMLWGATLRSPHPRARILSIDTEAAKDMPGVRAVLTHDDVPGRKTFGLDISDQPVLASDVVRYQGEPVAIVAAEHPESARRAAQAIVVSYEVSEPLWDSEHAVTREAPRLHPSGNIIRRVKIRHGEAAPTAPVVVSGDYEVGMQDQAFLGPESGLAVPDSDGGVDLYISTQWLHVDRDQLARSLDLSEDKVRLTLAGVGGAFGAREDLSIQIHCCLLALRTGRPVKMMYSREESFFGHVHRHPARMHYEHGATEQGKLVYVKACILLDGGAYASSSTAVCSNAACFACGPYEVPNATIDAIVVYTNNPPCGAMRGFGAVQTCFAHEAQMDLLAHELGIDPVELRMQNALGEGSELITGQRVEGPVPVAELLATVRGMDLPPAQNDAGPTDILKLPGGVSNSTHGEDVKRGVGFAVGFKNVGFSEGFDDYSTARVRLLVAGGEAIAEVHTAAAEVGQGVATIQVQIARSELGVARAVLVPADTNVGSAGSTSASRQTWMTGGAVKTACDAVRERVLLKAAALTGADVAGLRLANEVVESEQGANVALADVLGDEVIDETRVYRHRKTFPLDPETGTGDAHVGFAFAAHRVVADVDVELGLVHLVEVATAQDVGKALNPQAVEGQIEGGIAQGLGLALMEEIQVERAEVKNPSFTDYLIPTILDMPPVAARIFELSDPASPYGVKGVGEPPTISSTAAAAAALRAASGKPLRRVPVRPDDIVGLS
jgi:xanthine dehydrogenase D subunit